jgi:hypothetical protein
MAASPPMVGPIKRNEIRRNRDFEGDVANLDDISLYNFRVH